MTKAEMLAKRAKLLSDAHTIMSGANVTTEQRTQVDQMLADANTIKADVERLIALEAAEAETRSSGTIPRENPAATTMEDTRPLEERRKATDKALRQMLRGERFETRDLTVTADGAYVIPVGVTDPKIAKKSAGSIYDVVYKFRSSTGESVKVPLLNDIGNGFVLNSASITTTDPGVNGVTIAIDDIRSNPILLDNSLLNDVEFDLIGFVETAIQSRYLRTVSNWITNGNTSNVAGLVGAYSGITGATAGVLGYADFTALLAALDPAYAIGACFVMSNTTLANNVLNIADQQKRPLFLPFNDGGISGFAGTLFGYPVKLDPNMPSVATGNVAVLFGNMAEGYTFREVLPGVQIKKSADRWIELNRTGVVAFARIGGQPTNAGSVTSGTPQPVVSLTVR